MSRFTDKNVLVTGAASGIGKAVAMRVAAEGGNLALLDMNLEGLEAVRDEIKTKHPEAKCVVGKCDVSQFDETGKVIDELVSELGGLNALSHNAGILRAYNTHEMTAEQWNEVISVNLNGTFHVNRHCLPHLLKNSCSYIVNNSSAAANIRHPWLTAYAASKGGVKSFTRSLFIEYHKQGLHVNCVMPGGIDTPITRCYIPPAGADRQFMRACLCPFGIREKISPDSAASVIAMLMSDDAIAINGTEVAVDNGFVF